MSQRILILKLAAMGDVLRTTTLLPALKERYPESQITWVADPACVGLLRSTQGIDRLLPLDLPGTLMLQAEEFDLILSLDKEPAAAALGTSLRGHIKKGFGWSSKGVLYPLDGASEYAYRLGVDDELKFRGNSKTYQQITFEMCDLAYAGQEYQWDLTEPDMEHARWWAKGSGMDRRRKTVGLNTGAGERFAGKGWRERSWSQLIHNLQDQDVNILLLGGPREAELNKTLFRRHRGRGSLHDTGSDNTPGEFGALVGLCDAVVTGDTFGMHVAIACKKQVVALFGSTCHQEIELYGRGEKLHPKGLACSPCYKKDCDHKPQEECLDLIPVQDAAEALTRLLGLEAKAFKEEPIADPIPVPAGAENFSPSSQSSQSGSEFSSSSSQGDQPNEERNRDSRRHGRRRRWRRFRPRGSGHGGNRPSQG